MTILWRSSHSVHENSSSGHFCLQSHFIQYMTEKFSCWISAGFNLHDMILKVPTININDFSFSLSLIFLSFTQCDFKHWYLTVQISWTVGNQMLTRCGIIQSKCVNCGLFLFTMSSAIDMMMMMMMMVSCIMSSETASFLMFSGGRSLEKFVTDCGCWWWYKVDHYLQLKLNKSTSISVSLTT